MQSRPVSTEVALAEQPSSILVVEDEFLIRFDVSDELRVAGYEVIEAAHADEALAVLNSGVRIDLVFTDVRMPGSLDGVGLLKYVREAYPGVPVVLTSAHLEIETAFSDEPPPFLSKPCQSENVLDLIRRTLAKSE